MWRTNRIILPIGIYIAGLASPAGIAAPGSAAPANHLGRSEFARGLKDFQAGNFGNAAEHFKDAETVNPKEPQYHYYRAVTLAELKDDNAARKEYDACLKLKPAGELRLRCQLAITQYEKASAGAGTITPGAAVPASVPASVSPASSEGDGQGLTSVHDQVEREKQRAQAESESIGKRMIEDGKREAQWYKDSNLQKPTSTSGDTSNYNWKSRWELRQVDKSMQDNNHAVEQTAKEREQMAQDQANKLKELAKTKADAVDDAARNLDTQLKSSSGNNFHLKSEGTNLYIRNYAKDK